MSSRSTVLLIDDDARRSRDLQTIVERAGYRAVLAADGAAGLRLVAAHDCDAVFCEVALSDLDGLDVCHAIKEAPATRDIPVIVLLDADDEAQRSKAFLAGADDVCRRSLDEASLLGSLRAQLRIRALRRQVDELEGAVLTLSRAVDDRDLASSGQSEKVAHWAMQLGTAAGLKNEQLPSLYKAALLHDVGTVGVPVSVLTKPGRLDPGEFEIVKRHPLVGEEILRALPGAEELLPAVRHHHERIDGAGYPDGLNGDAIPLFARIIAITDAFVAMTSDRAYRRRRSREDAIHILQQGAGTQWDGELVDRLVRLVLAVNGEERAARAAS